MQNIARRGAESTEENTKMKILFLISAVSAPLREIFESYVRVVRVVRG